MNNRNNDMDDEEYHKMATKLLWVEDKLHKLIRAITKKDMINEFCGVDSVIDKLLEISHANKELPSIMLFFLFDHIRDD